MAGVDKKPGQQADRANSAELDEQIMDDGDDLGGDGIVDVDESTAAANSDQVAARRRLEAYLEEKRLHKELDDDLFS